MIKEVENYIIQFRYAMLKDKRLYKIMERKDFQLAAYVLENHADQVPDEELNFAMIYLNLSKATGGAIPDEEYKKRRVGLLRCLDIIQRNGVQDRLTDTSIEQILLHTVIYKDKGLIEEVLSMSRTLELSKMNNFYNFTYYYFLPKHSTRRDHYDLDERPSPFHTEEGFPELVKLVDKFCKKRKTHRFRKSQAKIKKPTL